MNKVVGTFTNEPLGATFFCGTNPVDGIWATPDVVVTGACAMPAGDGVGDHIMLIVDILTLSMVGTTPPRIVRADTRRLNTKISKATAKYTSDTEKNASLNIVLSAELKGPMKRGLTNGNAM